MAQVLIRNLDEKVVGRLKSGLSSGPIAASRSEDHPRGGGAAGLWDFWKAADCIRERLKRSGRKFSDSAELIRQDRDR